MHVAISECHKPLSHQALYLLEAQPYSLCPPKHSIISICEILPPLAPSSPPPLAPIPISPLPPPHPPFPPPFSLPSPRPHPLLSVHPPFLSPPPHSHPCQSVSPSPLPPLCVPIPASPSPLPPIYLPLLPVHPHLDHYLHRNQGMLQILLSFLFTHLRKHLRPTAPSPLLQAPCVASEKVTSY